MQMMGQMGGMPPFGGVPGFIPPVGGAAAPQQPQAGAAAAGTGAAAGAAAPGAAPGTTTAGAAPAAGGVRPPFMFPPFPFLPFTVPPPQPPPNFSGMSDTELEEMEGRERTSVEARIRCLRNIQVLLDAAVMEMQQYSAVVARATATTAAPTTAAAAASVVTNAAPTTGGVGDSVGSAASSTVAASIQTTSTSTTSSVSSTVSSSTSSVVQPELPRPLLSPSETGARPKVPATASLASKVESPPEEKVLEREKLEDKGEKPKENPFEALSEEPAPRTAEQVNVWLDFIILTLMFRRKSGREDLLCLRSRRGG